MTSPGALPVTFHHFSLLILFHTYTDIMASGTATLAPDNVVDLATRALRGDGNQLEPKTPYEAIALIGHACMAAVDFRLVGLGEDHNLGL